MTMHVYDGSPHRSASEEPGPRQLPSPRRRASAATQRGQGSLPHRPISWAKVASSTAQAQAQAKSDPGPSEDDPRGRRLTSSPYVRSLAHPWSILDSSYGPAARPTAAHSVRKTQGPPSQQAETSPASAGRVQRGRQHAPSDPAISCMAALHLLVHAAQANVSYMTNEAGVEAATSDDKTESAADGGTAGERTRKKRTPRPFPGSSFLEALVLAQAIQSHGAGQRIRRLTLFEALKRSPDSGPTRKLFTSSVQYGSPKVVVQRSFSN